MLPVALTAFPPQPAVAATIIKCGKADTVAVPPASNTYKVNTNNWNDVANSQCVKIKDANGDFSITSSTHNLPANGKPAAYPFIAKGCHWGSCTSATSSGLPKQASALFNVSSSWTVSLPSSGAYNAAYDIWFNQSPTTGGAPNGAELMVWLAHRGVQPFGGKLATAVPIAGATWDVWGGKNGAIYVITYVRTVNASSVCNLNLKAFIGDATARGDIKASWYLIAVEAGFEIWQDGVGLASSGFTALVE